MSGLVKVFGITASLFVAANSFADEGACFPMAGQGYLAGCGNAAGIKVGGLTVIPGLGLALGSDDNVYLTNLRRQSSTLEVLSPAAKVIAHDRDNIYSLSYRADLGRYSSASGDNYNDQTISGDADIHISPRASLKVDPELVWSHDPIGTTYGYVTPGVALQTAANKWRNAGVKGVFSYGSENAKGKVEVEGAYHSIKYLNNRVITVAYDKAVADAGATFFYRVRPKTSLLFQAKEEKISYANPALSIVPNSTQQYYMVGAKWEATAKTTGDLRVGRINKNYDASATPLPNFSGTGWTGNIGWNPETYSRVNLILSKQPEETTLPGSNYILTTSSTLGWDYDLSSRLTSHASYNQYLENFGGIGLHTRANNYALGVSYKMRRWLTTGLSWTNTSKSVDQQIYNALIYNRNVFMLTLLGTL